MGVLRLCCNLEYCFKMLLPFLSLLASNLMTPDPNFVSSIWKQFDVVPEFLLQAPPNQIKIVWPQTRFRARLNETVDTEDIMTRPSSSVGSLHMDMGCIVIYVDWLNRF